MRHLRIVRKTNPLPRDAAEWLQALAEAAEDLAPETLGFETTGVTSYRGELESSVCGALLPVSGDEECLQVGLFASVEGCRTLAAAFLAQPVAERLSKGEVADALGEIVCTLVSTVKVGLGVRDERLHCGLPLFVRGRLEPGACMERSALRMSIGPVEARLVVLRRAD